MHSHESQPQIPRRGFFKQIVTLILGGIAVLVPAVAGLVVLSDPLRRKAATGMAVRITTLDSLPDDGIPRKFPVLTSRTDAWNKYVNVPVGAVYLRRTSGDKIEALNVVCPHAGCFVDFLAERNGFLCPCHNSSFKVDGTIADKRSPSPRGLDSLPVEIRNSDEVWVTFQNFQAGETQKIPVA